MAGAKGGWKKQVEGEEIDGPDTLGEGVWGPFAFCSNNHTTEDLLREINLGEICYV